MERPLTNRREWDIARGSRIDGAFRAKNGTLRRLSAGPALWSKTRRHREFTDPPCPGRRGHVRHGGSPDSFAKPLRSRQAAPPLTLVAPW